MITPWPSLMVVVVAGGIGLPLLAQTEPGPALPPGFDAMVITLFGEVRDFSAKADEWAVDKDGREIERAEGLAVARLGEKALVEFDVTAYRGSNSSPVAAVLMKQARMDQVILIMEPRTGTIAVVYPRVQAVRVIHDPKMAEAWRGRTNHTSPDGAEISAIGEETIDGLTCGKHRVVYKDDQGRERELVTWNAHALQGFPIRMKTVVGEASWMLKFRDIELTPPEAKLFEVPAHYLQYTNFEELIQAAKHTARVRLRAWGMDAETSRVGGRRQAQGGGAIAR